MLTLSDPVDGRLYVQRGPRHNVVRLGVIGNRGVLGRFEEPAVSVCKTRASERG